MKNTLFTIGHSTHTPVRFMELLNQYSIQEVWDVRSKPYSKYNKVFNKELIEKELLKNNILYLFMGGKLGGRISNPSCYDNKGRLQYSRVAKLFVFQEALRQIVEKLSVCNIALMCSEGDPFKCHRMILVCRELCRKENVSEIKHILPDGAVFTHREMEKTLMDKFKLTPHMFRTEKECIEEAYDLQAQKIAYIDKTISNPLEEPFVNNPSFFS